MDANTIYPAVHSHYANAVQRSDRDYSERVAKQFGYTKGELESIPLEANLGLSCGNPHALANLQAGETVIDLGSGAGLDVFLAGKKVGPSGNAIGIDMNKEMLKKANEILTNSGATNVSFVESQITDVLVPDHTADCIISNCVINLVPEMEKQRVFDECFRLLKPGGRLAVSDILARKELPTEVKKNMALYVGCIAGASQVTAYKEYLRAAGFEDVIIVDTGHDLNVYGSATSNGRGSLCSPNSGACCSSTTNENYTSEEQERNSLAFDEVESIDFNEFAGSFKIFAIKG